MFRDYVLPYIVIVFYRFVSMTWRVRYDHPPDFDERLKNRKPMILAHWHGDELALAAQIKFYNVATMVSTSRDGEMMNKLVNHIGGQTSRGSSTRGGVSALKGLIRLVRKGFNPSMAVDGPKGPVFKVKPGVFEVSKILKLPIYYAGVSCSRSILFEKAWNKTYLPLPFAKVYISWRGPLPPVAKEMDARSPELSQQLEEQLHTARQQAVNFFTPGEPK